MKIPEFATAKVRAAHECITKRTDKTEKIT